MRLKSLSRIILAFVLTAAVPLRSQRLPSTATRWRRRRPVPKTSRAPGWKGRWPRRPTRQRQADLKRDTEKLLKLATELKESVDKTNESTLSVDVVKKAEEIEKLAHSVKDKMKAAY